MSKTMLPRTKPRYASAKIKSLAGRGLEDPSKLTPAEVREMCGSVMAHIERHVVAASLGYDADG